MRSLIVAYDLVGTDVKSQNYVQLIARIREYPNWAALEQSVWVVKTDSSTQNVRDDLLRFMHPTDRLFVGLLNREAAWHNVRCKDDWLQQNL